MVNFYEKWEDFDGILKDLPKMSILEYSEVGELIFEDYSCLDEYLEKEFIPKYLARKKKYMFDSHDLVEYFSISLSSILDLGINQDEFIHIMEYLNKLGIRVCGEDSLLSGEFENYDYLISKRDKSNFKNMKLVYNNEINENNEENGNNEDVLKKWEEYQKEKSIDLRNELVCLNIKISKRIAYEYQMKTGIPSRELESAGYEGLIHAIEKYDPSHNNEFSTFAFPIVKGYILKEISEWNGYKQRNFYYKYISYKKKIEEKYHCSIVDNPDMMVDYILDEMIQDGKISKMVKKEYKTLIFMCDPDLVQKGIFFDDLVCYEEFEKQEEVMLNQFMKQDIWLAFQELDERERKVIEESFGLFGIKKKYLEEIGKEMHISKQRVSQIKDGTLRKIKTLEKVRGLKEYL